jgi:transketolase
MELPTKFCMGNLKAKFEAFDWDVLEITEGNNIEQLSLE